MLSSSCEQKLKDALRKVPGKIFAPGKHMVVFSFYLKGSGSKQTAYVCRVTNPQSDGIVLAGVTEVVTDRRASKVTVSGKVDPQVLLKQAQKIKRKADFWTKDIYSRAFIDFIQSKTGRAEPEPEVTSSYHRHAPSEEGDCHHAFEESENLSSYEEYPGYPERDEQDAHGVEIERTSSHTPFEDRGYYSQYNYGQRSSDMDMPYGMPASSSFDHVEKSYGTVDDRPRYESPYYSHMEPSSFGGPYYERDSGYGDSSSSYRPSQGYGPSGLSNPGYMKRVIRDY